MAPLVALMWSNAPKTKRIFEGTSTKFGLKTFAHKSLEAPLSIPRKRHVTFTVYRDAVPIIMESVMSLRLLQLLPLVLLFPCAIFAESPLDSAVKQLIQPTVPQQGETKAVNLAPLLIEEVTVVDHGATMSWYAKTKNPGRHIAKDQLEIIGQQMLGNKVLATAGDSMLSGSALSKGQRRTFARQNWKRMTQAKHLRITIRNKRTGHTASKTVALSDDSSNPAVHASSNASHVDGITAEQFTDSSQELVVQSASYKGRGQFKIRLKNTGNRGIQPNQLVVRPIYYVSDRPPVIGKVSSNPSPIIGGKSKMVNGGGGGIYIDGATECSKLEKLVVEIRNPISGQLLEHAIPVERPRGKIGNLDFYMSNINYTVLNTGSYVTKYDIVIRRTPIYKGKYYGGDKDNIAIAENFAHTTATVKPGESKTVSLSANRVNAELRKQLPKLKEGYYGTDHVKVELYTDNNTDYCHGNSLQLEWKSMGIDNGPARGEEILYVK